MIKTFKRWEYSSHPYEFTVKKQFTDPILPRAIRILQKWTELLEGDFIWFVENGDKLKIAFSNEGDAALYKLTWH